MPPGRPPSPPPPLGPDGLPLGYPFKPEWEVTPRWVSRELASPSGEPPVLIDCRRDDEYAVARINGATLIPLPELESRVDEIRDLIGPHARPVVVHCHGGVRSMRAVALLRALGIQRAFSMAGGIDLWSIDVDPSVPRY